MTSKDADDTLFEKKYKEELKEENACYAGVCWAVDKIKRRDSGKKLNKAEEQEAEDAVFVFLDLYPLALKELASEASKNFIESIKSAEDRKTFHGRCGKPDPIYRKKAYFCKYEIRFLESVHKRLPTKSLR